MSTDNNKDRWAVGSTIEGDDYMYAPPGVFVEESGGWIGKVAKDLWIDESGRTNKDSELDAERTIIPRPPDAPASIPHYPPRAESKPDAFVPAIGTKPRCAADFEACPIGTKVEHDDGPCGKTMWQKVIDNHWSYIGGGAGHDDDYDPASDDDMEPGRNTIISPPQAQPEGADMNTGRKDDSGKNRLDLLPPHALWEIGRALTFGAQEYGDNNWRKVKNPRDRYTAALLRHVFAWMMGERNDSKSGLHHLAHAGACVLFLLDVEVKP